jgi:membrane associated rhomboid family serine protease
MFVAPFPCWKGAWPRWPWEIVFWAHIGGFVAGVVLIGWLDEECKIAVGKALSTDAKKTRELFIFF